MMPMPSVPQTMCFQLAHAYVPWQHYTPPFFSPAEGLAKGTIFPELWQPYTPRTKR
ncbi:MAG: spore coat associated protein CotJA [Heliobacteriaceae bacterium]|nr:spore coat associated protein CotJA [Heliobacteriaceae bacterium]MDD4588596.1 spore coat associated protein CotJA [Heliobacteriaceae bacterium]